MHKQYWNPQVRFDRNSARLDKIDKDRLGTIEEVFSTYCAAFSFAVEFLYFGVNCISDFQPVQKCYVASGLLGS